MHIEYTITPSALYQIWFVFNSILPMQSEKAYYRRIAGFFNAGRPVATPAGPANLVLKEETPWYQKSFLNLYRHTAGT